MVARGLFECQVVRVIAYVVCTAYYLVHYFVHRVSSRLLLFAIDVESCWYHKLCGASLT